MAIPLDVRQRKGSTQICTYCREALTGELPQVDCGGCGVVLHLECREEALHCPTIGCPGHWSDRIASPGTRFERFVGRALEEGRRRFTLPQLTVGMLVALVLLVGVGLQVRDQWKLYWASRASSSAWDADWLINKLQYGSPGDRAMARVGLIGLGPETVSRLVVPLAHTLGWARREAVPILRSKLTTRQALRDLIAEMDTTDGRVVDLVVDVLKTRPLPPLRKSEVVSLLQSLDGRFATIREILDAQQVPPVVVLEALHTALVSPGTRAAALDYVDRAR